MWIAVLAEVILNVLTQFTRINFVAHPVDGLAILFICEAD